MYNSEQLRFLVIRPTLNALVLWSLEAEELMMGTCAQESLGGTFLKQRNDGLALGAWQMEPATHNDIWQNYLPNQTILVNRLADFCRIRDSMTFDGQRHFSRPDPTMMIYHLTYACAMARIHYHRKQAPIPKTLSEQANYWKLHYNSPMGSGTPNEYIQSYNLFIGGPKKKKGE